MPRIKAFSTYPTEYSDALRKVVGGSSLELDFPTTTAAVSWRGQFYAFLGACRREGALPGASIELQDLARLSTQVMLVLRPGPKGSTTIVLQHRDRSWQAEALRNAREVRLEPTVLPPDALRDLLNADGTKEPKTERSEMRDAERSPYPKAED